MAVKRDKLKSLSIRELLDIKTIAEARIINKPIEPYSSRTASEYKDWRNFNELLQSIANELEERVINEFFD